MSYTRKLYRNEEVTTNYYTGLLEHFVELSRKKEIPSKKQTPVSIWDLEDNSENYKVGDKLKDEKSSADFRSVTNKNKDGIWSDVEDLKYPPRNKSSLKNVTNKSAGEYLKMEESIDDWLSKRSRNFYEQRNLNVDANSVPPAENVILREKTSNEMENKQNVFAKLRGESSNNFHDFKTRNSESSFYKINFDEKKLSTETKEKEIVMNKQFTLNKVSPTISESLPKILEEQKNSDVESMDVTFSKSRRTTPEKDVPRKKKRFHDEVRKQSLEDTSLKLPMYYGNPLSESKINNSHAFETANIKSLDENVSEKYISQSVKNNVNISVTDEESMDILNLQLELPKIERNVKHNSNKPERDATEKAARNNVLNQTPFNAFNSESNGKSENSVLNDQKNFQNENRRETSEIKNVRDKKPSYTEWLRKRNEKFQSQKSDLSNKSQPEKKNSVKNENSRNVKAKINEVPTLNSETIEVNYAMAILKVSALNKRYEVIVSRERLLQVKSSHSKLARMIPEINNQVHGIPYSAECVIIVLRFLFSASFSIEDFKVALELLSISKKYSLPRLQNTCVKYLSENPPSFQNVEEIIHYANHFKVLKDYNRIIQIDGLSLYQSLCENPLSSRFNISSSTCSVFHKIYIEPSEFCLPLLYIKHDLKGVFPADISNKLIFQSLKGSFSLTGIQIKLELKESKNARNVDILCSVHKGGKLLIDEVKRRDIRSLIILNFNKEIIVRSLEKAEINVMIEEIQPQLCNSVSKLRNEMVSKKF